MPVSFREILRQLLQLPSILFLTSHKKLEGEVVGRLLSASTEVRRVQRQETSPNSIFKTTPTGIRKKNWHKETLSASRCLFWLSKCEAKHRSAFCVPKVVRRGIPCNLSNVLHALCPTYTPRSGGHSGWCHRHDK